MRNDIKNKGIIAATIRAVEARGISCHTFKLGISSEQDAKPAAWLRLTHHQDCAIIDIKA